MVYLMDFNSEKDHEVHFRRSYTLRERRLPVYSLCILGTVGFELKSIRMTLLLLND